VLLAAALCLPALGLDPRVKVGGISLALPGPNDDFEEAGDKLRTRFFEQLAPAENRLLTAYLPARTLSEIGKGTIPDALEVYAMVQTPRKAEYFNCTPSSFEEIRLGLERSLGKLLAGSGAAVERELGLRVKSLGAKAVKAGRPEPLGGLYQKVDAAGFAMLSAIPYSKGAVTMAGGLAAVRVRERLLLVYLFRKYESVESVTWIRQNLELWSDAIMAKNK
jgi:hypothetical protein